MHDPELAERMYQLLQGASANVLAVYLFGTVARGTDRAASDVDLGVLLRDAPAATLEGRMLAYEAALECELGRPVQLVILNDAPVDLVHRVLTDGRLLLDRDRAARLRFEVRSRNEYFDLLPVLRQYRAAALAKAGAGLQ